MWTIKKNLSFFPTAFIWGDPHIETLDGLEYTFNGIGEYTMLTTFDGSFTLQARTAQIVLDNGAEIQASKWSAFAARVASGSQTQTVQLEMNDDETGMKGQRGLLI